MTGERPRIDGVTVEIMGHYLSAVAEEMGVALVRTAYSANIKERGDCSCGIFTANGEMAAFAAHVPIHLGSMIFAVDAIKSAYSDIAEGDMFAVNDPYGGGGSHPMDITVAAPAFFAGEIVAWAINIAHHSDIGGRVAGSQAQDNRSRFQEGLCIPVVRLATWQGINKEVMRLIAANSRLPWERGGDIRAQVAADRVGVRRLEELGAQYGFEVVMEGMAGLLLAGEKEFRASLSRFEGLEARGADKVDDESGDGQAVIRVRVEVTDGELWLDFRESDPQSESARNLVEQGLLAASYYAAKAAFLPEGALNGGYYRAIHVLSREGSVVKAKFPAATGSRIQTAQRVVDSIFQALSAQVTGVQAGSHGGATITMSGVSEESGRAFTHYESIGGGGGARFGGQGLDGVQVHTVNTGNVPLEVLELEFPLRVERYGLIEGSGGRGQWRGGKGIERVIRALQDGVVVSAMADRQREGPPGLLGGEAGASGSFSVVRGGIGERLPATVSGLELSRGDMLRIRTSGGGGYGLGLQEAEEEIGRDGTGGE